MQLSLRPPAGASSWRILRKAANAFGTETDATALFAYEGQDLTVVDAEPGLINEQPVFYRPYYFVAGAWVPAPAVAGTPRATFKERSADAQQLVRDRLEAGLAVEVARGTMQHETGAIPVYTAPPLADQNALPLVTVHLESEGSSGRAIGELLLPDYIGSDNRFHEHEGWMADVSLEIIGWSLNPDERAEMRRALRRIVVANLPVFAAAGLLEITFTQRDIEFLQGEYDANVFQTVGTFNCQAPVIVETQTVARVTDVVASVAGTFF